MMGFGMPGVWEISFILTVLVGLLIFVVGPIWYIITKAKTSERKPRLWVDALLTLSAAGLAPGSIGLCYYLTYLGGIYNKSPISGILGCFLYPLSILLWLILVVRALMYIKRTSAGQIITRFVFTIITILVIFISPKFHVPGMSPFMKGFKIGMENSADIVAIREWLKTVEEPQKYNFFQNVEGLPEAIKKLHPKYVGILELPGDKGFEVRLTWGSGFGHWGLVVGPEDMEIPPTEISEYDKRGEYRERLADGSYIWYEVQSGDYVIK